MENPLGIFSRQWLAHIEHAKERKKDEFDKYASEVMRFYDGDREWLYENLSGVAHRRSPTELGQIVPSTRMTVNRVFEAVSIFGPMMYPRNPRVLVNPREYPEITDDIWAMVAEEQFAQQAQVMGPMLGQMPPEVMQAVQQQFVQQYIGQQQMALSRSRTRDKCVTQLLQGYLNYIPNETRMYDHARECVNECIMKGLSTIWPEVYTPPGGSINIISPTWVTIDDVVWDPDAETPYDIQWIARRCRHPRRLVEQMYGLEPGILKANLESSQAASAREAGRTSRDDRRRGKTYDLVTYWKVYSKVGLGRLPSSSRADADEILAEKLGDYVFFAVAEGVPFPLNLQPDWATSLDINSQAGLQELQAATSWQVPHWQDSAWPCEFLSFHRNPDKLYPMSHLHPAIGEQYALDWGYSMLLSKLKVACLTRIGLSHDVDTTDQDTLMSTRDFEVLKLKKAGNVREMFQQFDFGTFNPEIYRVLQIYERNYDKRTGLMDHIYGAQGNTQLRSSAEAQNLYSQLNVRPDDMRERVESFMTQVFRRMALAARTMLTEKDVEPLFGPAAGLWRYVSDVPIETMVREYEYRIEAGSMSKPNPEARASNMTQLAQTLLPMMQGLIPMYPPGDPGNSIIPVINGLARDVYEASGGREWKYDIPIPPPPPMPQPMQGGPGGQEQEGPEGPGVPPGAGPPPQGPAGPPMQQQVA